MLNGRPHGQGRLEERSGEILEGTFRDGILDGNGSRIAADGSRYEGAFRAGIPFGEGRLTLRTGEIYVGGFASGKRHGHGRTTLPGGTSYESEWAMGVELGSRRNMVADATLGGLLKAQSGGGDAGKVEIGIQIDQRMTQESDMRYTQFVGEEAIELYPEDEDMNKAWRGDGEVSTNEYYVTGIDWENVPAFVAVDLHTADKSRVKLDGLELKVKDSIAYRKPMLTLANHIGCVGFRPSFSLKNHGWGDPRNVQLSVQFTGETPDEAARRGLFRECRRFRRFSHIDRRCAATGRRQYGQAHSERSPASRETVLASAAASFSIRSASARSRTMSGARTSYSPQRRANRL